MTATAVLAALALVTTAPPPPVAPSACTTARPVSSPCEGLLVPMDEARAAILCRSVELPSCRARARRDAALCESRSREAATVAANLRRRIVDARPRWWESPWFGAAVGVVVGVAAGVAIGAVVRR